LTEFARVPYTVWSHGRLVGETDLGFIDREGNHRTGYFYPSAFGEELIPIFNEPRRIMKELGSTSRACEPGTAKDDPEWVALHSAWEVAKEREQSLALELRDERGAVIPTELVGICDTDLTLELYPGHEHESDDEPLDPEVQAEIDLEISLLEEWRDDMQRERELLGLNDDEDEAEDTPLPRFQVQVLLVYEWAVP
jgi:hypothetical protein